MVSEMHQRHLLRCPKCSAVGTCVQRPVQVHCVPARPGSLVTGGALGTSSHSCVLPVAFWGRIPATVLADRVFQGL